MSVDGASSNRSSFPEQTGNSLEPKIKVYKRRQVRVVSNDDKTKVARLQARPDYNAVCVGLRPTPSHSLMYTGRRGWDGPPPKNCGGTTWDIPPRQKPHPTSPQTPSL